MTAAPRRITAFLLRVGLLTVTLAIIAGVFGMHIMAGAHSIAAHAMPATGGAGHTSTHLHSSTAGHDDSGTDLSPHRFSAAAETVSGASSCSAGGSCPEMSASGAGCVLSAKTTSLAAPLPGTAPYALQDFGGAAAGASYYAYSPDSPSPGDLCISRT